MIIRIFATSRDKFVSHLERQAEPMQQVSVLFQFGRNSKFPVNQVANGFQPRDLLLRPTPENLARWEEISLLRHYMQYRHLPSVENAIIPGHIYAAEEAETGKLFLIESFRVQRDRSLVVTLPLVQNGEYNPLWVERELRSRDEMIQNLHATVAILDRFENPAEVVELN